MRNIKSPAAVFLILFFAACHETDQKKETPGQLTADMEKKKISGAVSCTQPGCPFRTVPYIWMAAEPNSEPTSFGDLKGPAKGEEGMVWIPGVNSAWVELIRSE